MTAFRRFSPSSIAFLVAALSYLVFASHLPITLFFPAAHDDALYWKQGSSIADGHWLGQYDNKTLLRGPAFAIFLALSSIFKFSLTFALALLHVFAFLIVFTSIPRRTRENRWVIAALILGMFHPALFPQRAIRDYFYASIVIACFGLAVLTFRFWAQLRNRYVLLGALGVFLGVAWLTRDETIFIVPGIILVFLPLLFGASNNFWKRLLSLTMGFAVMSIFFLAPQFIVAKINKANYGVEFVSERNSPNFSSVMSTLYSMNMADQRPYVPVPEVTLAKLYQLSPKFAYLKPFLQGDGLAWQRPGCTDIPSTCGEFAAGWLEFAIRDAAQSAGFYTSGTKADSYFGSLDSELKLLCQKGRIKCGPAGYSLIPWLSRSQIAALPTSLMDGLYKSLSLPPGALLQGAEQPGPDSDHLRGFLGNPSVASSMYLTGWFLPKTKGDWLNLNCRGETETLAQEPSPDLVQFFGDKSLSANRFSIRKVTNVNDCELTNRSGTVAIPLKGDHPSSFSLQTPGGLITVDSFSRHNEPLGDFMEQIWKFWNYLYSFLGPTAVIVSVAVAVNSILKFPTPSNRRNFYPLILVAAISTTVIARLAMLAIIDVSMFRSMYDTYLQPVYAMVAILPVYLLALFVQRRDI